MKLHKLEKALGMIKKGNRDPKSIATNCGVLEVDVQRMINREKGKHPYRKDNNSIEEMIGFQ